MNEFFGYMKAFFSYVLQNQEWFVSAVIIMVSTIIVFIDLMRVCWLDKTIKNKDLKRFVLSFGSIALMFMTTAGLFAIYTLDWQYYVPFSVVSCVAMIVGYWLYKHFTQVRTLIHNIGSFVITKVWDAIVAKVNGVAKSTEVIGNAIDDILKGTSKVDKDMDDLKKL